MVSNRMIITSVTTLMFLVVGITGIMLFFHIADMYVKEMHNFLGIAMVIAVLLHGIQNLANLKRYATTKVFAGLTALCLVIVIGFLVAGSFGGGKGDMSGKVDPMTAFVISDKFLNADISVTLPMLVSDVEAAKVKMKSVGVDIDNVKTLNDVAKNGMPLGKLFNILGIGKPQGTGQNNSTTQNSSQNSMQK